MKRFLSLVLPFLLLAGAAAAQPDTATLPYKRFPELPPLQLLLGDSSTMLTKDKLPRKKPTLIFFFSTGCGHCQHTTEELVQYRDSLPNMNLVMATFASVSEMNAFRQRYHTDSLPNAFVGKDVHFLLPPFYGIANLPFLAYYNKKGEFVDIIDGGLHVPQIAARIRELEKRGH
ncbi:MAG: hypothetical protein EOO16_17450 [Chitinophagaceae bacterium]|nr:MAG: hypothetical protein EOO16_17450 [Chitinophagaceae bacterium]